MFSLNKIENLAISGAGVKIVAQIGAVEVLEEKGILSQIKRVAGTSAGAIIASLVAVGYTAKELKELCFSLDFERFEDGKIAEKLNLFNDYGLYKGDAFLDFIREKIELKTGSKYTTFAGLYAQGMKDLSVVACRLNDCSAVVFNYENTPHIAVADAVRFSMSIPIEFEPHKIHNDISTYVDVGVVLNYPLNLFPTENTIGICFNPNEKADYVNLKRGQFPLYLKLMIQSFMASQDKALTMQLEDLQRSIMLDSCGVSATKFNLTEKDKMNLYESGKSIANYFIIN